MLEPLARAWGKRRGDFDLSRNGMLWSAITRFESKCKRKSKATARSGMYYLLCCLSNLSVLSIPRFTRLQPARLHLEKYVDIDTIASCMTSTSRRYPNNRNDRVFSRKRWRMGAIMNPARIDDSTAAARRSTLGPLGGVRDCVCARIGASLQPSMDYR
jgi:hypothetical protein